jgi:hypothetical protein
MGRIEAKMFSAEYREAVREQLIDIARNDAAITAAAVVGSSASGGDRWSDLDLTFAVADGNPLQTVLADWTSRVVAEFDAAMLLDVPFLSTIYRVFLFPGALQVDLSFTPAAEFGARGPRFQLIFGEAVERPWTPPPPPEHIFGQGVHHAVRAHICLERGKFFQAEYWLHEVRNEGLALACSRLGLEVRHGGGFDHLPASVHDAFAGSLAGNVTEAELRRALTIATSGLLNEAAHFPSIDKRVPPMLAEICQPASV